MQKISEAERKDIQIEILKEFKRFCEFNHLNYSLGGGTLLGAIRHQGYIPWDDDIDVMLPRADYRFLLKHFKHSHLKIQHKDEDKTYPFPFAKLFDTRTQLTEDSSTLLSGVGIDVFPIDASPNNEKIFHYWFHLTFCLWRYRRQKIRGIVKETVLSRQKKIRLFLRKIFLKIIPYACLNFFYDFTIQFFNVHYSTAKFVGAFSGAYAKQERTSASAMRCTGNAMFEGEQYSIIQGYDEYLRNHYGNYMQIPPKDKQISHHSFHAFFIDANFHC